MDKIADLFTKYNCTNCQDDINGIRVHCSVCENFDLCLQCFAAGAEIGPHLNNHAYQFMDTGTTILSVFRGKGAWTAREEIRLLDAIEQFGFGNWEDISKHIETKSAEDAKEEYVNKFVNGTIGRHTWTPAQLHRPSLVDHTSDDAGPLGVGALQRLPPLDVTTEEAVQLGYMPNRDGFEREYDPTAEQLISTMALIADDTEADYLLKLAHVDMYTRRLRERMRRKRLVRDYQLVANFFRNRNYAQHPGMTREQKEFRDRFRVFAQFYTANEYDRLLGSLEREKELRIRMAELYRYRQNGLTKIDECRHFEQHAAMATHRSNGLLGHGKTDNTPLSTGKHRPQGYSSHSPQHSKIKTEPLGANEVNSNSTALRNMHHIDDPTSSGVLSHNKNYSGSCRGSSTLTTTSNALIAAAVTPVTMTTATPSNLKSNSGQQHLHQLLPSVQPQVQSEQTQQHQIPLQQLQTTMKNQQLPQFFIKIEDAEKLQENNNNTFDNSQSILGTSTDAKNTTKALSSILRMQLDELKHLPQPLGSNLLTQSELNFCKSFNLSPTTYLSQKTLLLSGAPINNNLSIVEHSLRKYFIKVGWLSH